MADVKAAPKKIVARCGERVKVARLTTPLHPFGDQVLVMPGVTGAVKGGAKVEAMALHPSGLAVVAAAGPFKGERLVIPGVQVEYVILADEET